MDIKQEKDKSNLNQNNKKEIIRIIKIKFILFFIFCFLLLGFFWYYITCFCGIYVNTQIHLISDSFISLITSLMLPFFIGLIPGMFRILSLSVKKPSRRFFYKFSLLLENYLL